MFMQYLRISVGCGTSLNPFRDDEDDEDDQQQT
jgi:hypothetical protein